MVLGLLLLAGCASYEAQPLAPEQNAARLGQRSLDDPALREFVTENGGEGIPADESIVWDFDSLTLAAFYFHPDLDVARAQWEVTRAGQVTAGQRPNPVFGLAPGYNSTTAEPSPRIITLTSDITLEIGGKRGYRLAQAEQLSEAGRLNVASVAWAVRSGVRTALLELYGADRSEALLEQQQSIHAENVRIVEFQYQAGAVSAFELTQARLAANRARLALLDARRRSSEARVQLADAIGVPVAGLDGVELSYAGFEREPAAIVDADVRLQALSNRADILAALARYAASQASLQLEIARQYPDVHLGPGYEYDQGDDKWSVGLSLTLPAFNRNEGPIAEARARRTEAAAQFNALQARVLGEVDLALAGYRAASAQQADADALLGDLTRQERVAQSMLELGEISRSELAALQLELSVSALAQLDAVVQVERAAGQLEDAVQSPLGLSAALWQRSPRMTESAEAQDNP